MLATSQALGAMSSLSGPGVSNDNRYLESLFKTFNYRPACPPEAFDTLFAARTYVAGLVRWHTHEHRHSAMRLVTPSQRHPNLGQDVPERHAALYEYARQHKPLRWKGPTSSLKRIDAVHLNPSGPGGADDGLIPRPRYHERKTA
jgi:hypothetical protein